MTPAAVTLSLPISPELQRFAAEKGLSQYLPSVIELARQAFAGSSLELSLGQDAEEDGHQYIAIDVDVSNLETEEILTGQRAWSAGVSDICPSAHAVYFVLGWR